VLGEFFAAWADEIDNAAIEDGPYDRFPTVEAKNQSEVTIATLGEILGVGNYDELIDRIAEGPEAASGEAGVLTVPSEVCDALAALGDVRDVAQRWGRTDELAGWEPESLEEVLRDLVPLARRASDEGRELWYWWSL
jgi:hypothetical protein